MTSESGLVSGDMTGEEDSEEGPEGGEGGRANCTSISIMRASASVDDMNRFDELEGHGGNKGVDPGTHEVMALSRSCS